MKKDVLRGNFKTKNEVHVEAQTPDTLEARFETEALKRLGGSIAFVSKRKVMWDLDEDTGGAGEKP